MSWFAILKDEKLQEECCQKAKDDMGNLYKDLIALEREKSEELRNQNLTAKLTTRQIFDQMSGKKVSYTRTHELRDLIKNLKRLPCDNFHRGLRRESVAMQSEQYGGHTLSERSGRSFEEKTMYKILMDWDKCDAGDWHESDPGPADKREFRRRWT